MRQFLHWGYQFCLWFALFFCVILLGLSGTAIFQYGREFQKGSAFFAVVLIAVGLVLAFAWLAYKISSGGRRVSAMLFLGIIALQVFFLVMVSRPMSIADPARVQNEALEMLRYHGGQMNAENIYLQNYPNNHFVIIIFYYFYKLLEIAGIAKVWIPTIVLNTCFIDLGIYLTYAAAKKIKGVGMANLTLLLFLLCPTTYLWLTSAYTNTLSFPFLMGILYLGLDVDQISSQKRTVARISLLGVLMVAGYFVRPTTAIAAIALVLYRAVRFCQKSRDGGSEDGGGHPDWKGRLGGTVAKFVLLLCVCGVTWLACDRLIASHVDREKFTGQFPAVHWVMMGMNEESQGGYSREDRLYTGSFPELEDKRRADVERLGQRLRHMGIAGVGKQFMDKLARVWALGDDDAISNARYAYDFPPFFSYVAGNNNTWFVFYMQAFRICMFLFMGFALLGMIGKRKCTPLFLYGLTFLGAVCFFLLWEAGRRYNVCFNGICLLLMAVGICELRQWMAGRVKRVMGRVCVRRNWIKRIIKAGGFVAMICLFVASMAVGADCKKTQGFEKDVCFCSKMGTDAESINWKGIRQADLLEQTIEAGRMEWSGQWNRIKIFFANFKPSEREAEYQIELISMEDDLVVYRRKIAPCNIKPDGGYVIRLKKKKSSRTGYKLRLTHLGNHCNLIPMVCKFPLLDPYPYGSLSVNGRERNWDLSMSIYDVRK